MKGDFSRFTFDKTKHYRNVLTQQGRVAVDADPNEQQFITSHRIETESVDTIGPTGAPQEKDKNFQIDVVTNNSNSVLKIKSGHYYVNGIMCESEKDYQISVDATQFKMITDQPDKPSLPIGTNLSALNGNYLVYLDVWQKHITYVDDDSLREKALGGPDTSTRLKTVWQVKLYKGSLGDFPALESHNLGTSFASPANSTKGKLTPSIHLNQSQYDLCNAISVNPNSSRQQNQLYRIEIHDVSAALLKIKWSRNNVANVSRCEFENTLLGTNKHVFKVHNVQHNNPINFDINQIVELLSIDNENNQISGLLATVVARNTDNGEVTVTFIPDINDTEMTSLKKIVSWDGITNVESANFDYTIDDALKIKLTPGRYHAGDYWLIPLRNSQSCLEWPTESGSQSETINYLAQPPHGITHNYCCLATVNYDHIEGWFELKDCRKLYPLLTDLTSLFYAGGDGQQASASSLKLEFPLQVGVANGRHPVSNAKVIFNILNDNSNGFLEPGTHTQKSIIVQTDQEGIAKCTWTLDDNLESQQVEAKLDGLNNVPIRFTGYLRKNSDVDTVMRVINVSLRGQILKNDTRVDIESFLNDIIIECDSNIYRPSVRNKPVCFITIHQPVFFRLQTSDAVYGYSPLILATRVDSENNKLQIRLNDNAKEWLRSEFAGVNRRLESDILVWLTLKGNYIWSEDKVPGSRIYLDGDVYGVHNRPSPPFTHIPDPIIDAQYSGDGKSGGDLEMWFWLFPSDNLVARVDSFEVFSSNNSSVLIMNGQRKEISQTSNNVINKFEISFSQKIDLNSFTLTIGRLTFSTNTSTFGKVKLERNDTKLVVELGTTTKIPANSYDVSIKDVISITPSGQRQSVQNFDFKLILVDR